MGLDEASPVRFGEFELDVRAGLLRKGGQPVNLPPQQFTVLVTLVESAGALVTRDQIRRKLWADDEFVDFDAGLNFCIRQLRLALGDAADQPQFIQTVPRRGYRFVGDVVAVNQSTAEAPAAPDPPSRSASPRAWLSAVAVALIVTVGVVWWLIDSGGGVRVSAADARIADAHAARGFVALNDEWDWDVAERAFTRAQQLDPGHEVALISLSRLSASQGHFAPAVEFARRATVAHPESTRARVTLGWALLYSGDFAAALEACSGTEPAFRMCRLHLEAASGADVSETIQRVLSGWPADGPAGGRFQRATFEAWLGRSADALRNLDAALAAREPDATFALVHPAFKALRADPDFRRMTTAAGLSIGK